MKLHCVVVSLLQNVFFFCFFFKLFLKARSPPIEIPDDKLIRWHPEFDLDNIPDVEEAELPKPPLTGR